MELILFLIYWVLVNIGLLYYIRYVDTNYGTYETLFCRDVRASLGMFAYRSDLEETREYLNSSKSKF